MKKILYFLCFITLVATFSCSSNGGNDDDPGDACNAPNGISTTQITETSVTINWTTNGSSTFEIEYGESGFTQGQGQTITTSGSSRNLTNLQPGTNYQFYIRANCGSDGFSNWIGAQSFTTNSVTCMLPFELQVFNNGDNAIVFIWNTEDEEDSNQISYTVEYGEAGFTLGTGTSATVPTNSININNVMPSTEYDFYVRANCVGNVSTEYVGPVTFTTQAACTVPSSVTLFNLEACSFSVGWNNEGETAWEIEYGEVGFAIGTGTVVNTSNTSISLNENINPNTTYEVYVRANCGSEGFSEYADAQVVTTNQADSNTLTGLYTGTYTYESVITGVFDDVFGSSQNVVLSATADNVRTMNVTYNENLGFGQPAMDFEFSFTFDGEVIVTPSQNTFLTCGGSSILLGPISTTQNYEICDDSVIEFSFLEFYLDSGNCGETESEVRIRLTKQ